MHRWLSLLLVAGCRHGGAATPAPREDDLALLAHPWKVYGHVLSDKSAVNDDEATELDGREVAITAAGFESPWQGTCEDYGRSKRTRLLVEVASELSITRAGLGLGERVIEFRLICQNKRSPPMTILVDPERPHAVTCWNGACYLLGH